MKKLVFFALFFTLLSLTLISDATASLTTGLSPITEDSEPPFQTSSVYLPLVQSSLPVVIPNTTKVLSEATTQYLTSIAADETTYTFSTMTSELATVVPDDIIVADITSIAPNGFLREVTAISTTYNGQVVIETASTTLENAIETGDLEVSDSLVPDNVQTSVLREGITLASPSFVQGSEVFIYDFDDVVLFDNDGNLATTDDQITANGKVTLKPSYNFDLQIEGFHLENLDFLISLEETAELNIESQINHPNAGEEVEIARHEFAPFTVWIKGFLVPFPVVIQPVMSVNVGLDGRIYADVIASVTQKASMSAGLDYNDGNWNPTSQFSNDFEFSLPTLSVDTDFKGYTGAQMTFLLYGFVGPYAEARAFLQLEADTNTTPWWELYGGLEMLAGAKIEIFSHVIADYDTTLVDKRWLLADSEHLVLNDNFGDAFLISQMPYAHDQATVDATTANNDPDFSCEPYFSGQGSHTVWYEYMPTADGTLMIDTFQSDYDTVLAVWSGSQGNLQLVDCNDDSSGVSQSQVSTGVTAGTIYFIEIAGYDSDAYGTLSLNGDFVDEIVDVTLDIAYTTDYWGNPKSSFRPGETIQLRLRATNHTDNTAWVAYNWNSYDPYGTKVSNLSYNDFTTYIFPGTDGWYLNRGIANDAFPGTYSYFADVAINSNPNTRNTTFTVQGSPISIHLLQTAMAKEVYNGYPYGVTNAFTTDEDYVYSWSIWEGASGAHTIYWKWYRPDGVLYGDHSLPFDATSSLVRTWVGFGTLAMDGYWGEWRIETYMDGVYEGTQYFTLSAGTQSQSGDMSKSPDISLHGVSSNILTPEFGNAPTIMETICDSCELSKSE